MMTYHVQFLLLVLAGWVNRQQQDVIDYQQEALLHGPEQIADLPVPVGKSPGAVSIGHAERGHLVEYLAPQFGVQLVASPTFEPASRAP